jgi:hypothetical protein
MSVYAFGTDNCDVNNSSDKPELYSSPDHLEGYGKNGLPHS